MIKKILYPFIAILSFLHREILNIRYYLKFLKSSAPDIGISTVSVGNLQMGGGGKTPLCMLLLNDLIEQKINFIHSTRAYKSKVESTGMLVDLENAEVEKFDAAKVGDEPLLLMKFLKKGHFVLGKLRTKLLKQLAQKYFIKPHFDILLLEDAYQHFKLYRDLDILLIDVTCPVDDFVLAPVGYLREPPENMWRADTIIMSRWNLISPAQQEQWKTFIQKRMRSGTKLLKMDYMCQGLVALDKSDQIKVKEVKNQKLVLFSAIANPKSFVSLINSLGADVLKSFEFSDHSVVSKVKMKTILDYAAQNQAKVVCTEKDAIKLQEYSNSNSIYYVKLKTDVLTLDEMPWNFLNDLNLSVPV